MILSALNLRLTRIEEVLYGHDHRTASAIQELQNHSKELIPALRLLQDQAVKCEAKYLALGGEALDASSKEELVRLMQSWDLYMNNASSRLDIEAKAVEFAIKNYVSFRVRKIR